MLGLIRNNARDLIKGCFLGGIFKGKAGGASIGDVREKPRERLGGTIRCQAIQ
jgi:hypothetical protein